MGGYRLAKEVVEDLPYGIMNLHSEGGTFGTWFSCWYPPEGSCSLLFNPVDQYNGYTTLPGKPGGITYEEHSHCTHLDCS